MTCAEDKKLGYFIDHIKTLKTEEQVKSCLSVMKSILPTHVYKEFIDEFERTAQKKGW
jgi:hypothetical protein